jgi:hypothetical protein
LQLILAAAERVQRVRLLFVDLNSDPFAKVEVSFDSLSSDPFY